MEFSIKGDWNKQTLDFEGEFGDGERVALLGESGSGKTTLLRFLSGLNRAANSRVSVGGDIVRNAWHAHATLVHQHAVMFAHHSVSQTLKYGEKYKRADHELPLKRWLSQLELNDLVDQPCTQLSGGQAQRVALLRAIMSQHNWLLLDESFSAMDNARLINACDVVNEYCQITNAGLVLASHNDIPQRYLCDSAYLVDELSGTYESSIFHQLNSAERNATTTTINVDVVFEENGFLKALIDEQLLYVSIPDRWQAGKARVSLDAAEISIGLGSEHQTSMVNRLNVIIQSVSAVSGGGMLLTLRCSDQTFLTLISEWSFKRLNLEIGQAVFAEFKVGAVQWHGQGH